MLRYTAEFSMCNVVSHISQEEGDRRKSELCPWAFFLWRSSFFLRPPDS